MLAREAASRTSKTSGTEARRGGERGRNSSESVRVDRGDQDATGTPHAERDSAAISNAAESALMAFGGTRMALKGGSKCFLCDNRPKFMAGAAPRKKQARRRDRAGCRALPVARCGAGVRGRRRGR